MFKLRNLNYCLLALLLLATACSGVGKPAPTQESITVPGSPSTPVRVQMSMPFAPTVNQDVQVDLQVSSAEAVKGVQASFELPEGVELVSSQAQEQIDLDAGETFSFSAVIRFTRPGQYAINGRALSEEIAPGTRWGDLATINITVGETSSSFGFETTAGEQAESGGGSGGEGGGGYSDCTNPAENQPGCVPPPPVPIPAIECPPPSSEPATPISLALTAPDTAKANEIIPVTVVVCSIQDAPQTQVRLELPAGVELLQGALTWPADLLANQPLSFTLSIRFTASGEYSLSATALYSFAEGTVWGDSSSVVVRVK